MSILTVTSLSDTPLKLMWSWELTASLRSTMTCKRRWVKVIAYKNGIAKSALSSILFDFYYDTPCDK